ncbi:MULTISPECIES: LytR C-terminal domain-containing protein [unclassified Microbacterium]|uniref:LytR C-terminal domain-containing protein n=1 Tax=unclassified Microbacterium TaxID=2609290 RepID=UPI000F54EDFB|nr:LytR C-terminal domain-containing protein [Microbacterium sp. ABRD28]AZC14504.1 LytR family transcriptional regulator [Microbacterium sp. ABRD28]
MPKRTYPRDRFDDLPADGGRVGAHRAENPRMRPGVVLLWASLATIVLIVVGIFGTLLTSGRIQLAPDAEPTASPQPTVEPVIDTSYSVQVLNATPEQGLATQVKDEIVAAGWSADAVSASGAGTTDFAETTVYYAFPGDQAAAAGLADLVLGGARIEQTDVYQLADDPNTPEDESQALQLTVVIGLDRTTDAPAEETPAP